MKLIAGAAVAGILTLAGWSRFQDNPLNPVVKPADKRPCDVLRIERLAYCPTCNTYPSEDEIRSSQHTPDKGRIVLIPTCMKVAYPCKMHGDSWVLHARRCCPVNVKDCCTDLTVMSKVEYRCDTCLMRGST